MTRILFCTQTAYLGGGAEEWLRAVAGALGARGWDVVVGLARGARFHSPERFLERYPYPQTIEFDGQSGLREERYCQLVQALDRLRPDVIVPVQIADALYAAARWKRRRGDARLVTCLHGQSAAYLADLRACADDIDLGVSVSRRGERLIRETAGLPPEAAAHLPTGVPAPLAPAGRDGSRIELAYVGRLDEREKRVGDLADLVPLLDGLDYRVHVVGEGPEGEPLRRRLATWVDQGRVVFHGLLGREELYRSIYPRLHGLLIFSPAEGGPIVAWEAMVHGAVPVTSDYLGREEEGVLRHETNCLVFPVGGAAAAAAAVRRLADRTLFERLSAEAARLPAGYTEAGFGDAWDGRLRELLGRPPRIGRRPLPRMLSPGRLSTWLPNERLLAAVRKLFCRRREAADSGGEWPHAYGGLTFRARDVSGTVEVTRAV